MEVKVSTALETALEFISEVATCGDEELQEKTELANSFIASLVNILEESEIDTLDVCLNSVRALRRQISRYKRIGR